MRYLKKFTAILITAVITVSICACNEQNTSDNSSAINVNIRETNAGSPEISSVSSETNTPSSEKTPYNATPIQKETEVSEIPISCPDISEQAVKNIEELMGWLNKGENDFFTFEIYKERFEPFHELIKEKGLFFPTLNGKPMELDYNNVNVIGSPMYMATSDSLGGYNLHIATSVEKCSFTLLYLSGSAKEELGNGIVDYMEKRSDKKSEKKHTVSKISIYDENQKKSNEIECIRVKYGDSTEIQFIYKGVIVYFMAPDSLLESDYFKNLGFTDLLK
jgi:hypothetical protein